VGSEYDPVRAVPEKLRTSRYRSREKTIRALPPHCRGRERRSTTGTWKIPPSDAPVRRIATFPWAFAAVLVQRDHRRCSYAKFPLPQVVTRVAGLYRGTVHFCNT